MHKVIATDRKDRVLQPHFPRTVVIDWDYHSLVEDSRPAGGYQPRERKGLSKTRWLGNFVKGESLRGRA